ncbi:hypothetical protein [Desulfosarcina sp.]|uniref:hypothetical protein n=1 Tax=Desulfosarcina sp. TaxID=2027861 RepID=UPI0039709F48
MNRLKLWDWIFKGVSCVYGLLWIPTCAGMTCIVIFKKDWLFYSVGIFVVPLAVTVSKKFTRGVIPAQAGIYNYLKRVDPRLCGDDTEMDLQLFTILSVMPSLPS